MAAAVLLTACPGGSDSAAAPAAAPSPPAAATASRALTSSVVAPASTPARAAVSPLPLPDGAAASLRLTTGPGGVTLSWIAEGEGRGLRASRWTDAGWGPELDVTRRPGLLGSWADAPTVAAGAAHLVAVWIEEGGEGHATHLWASRSNDGGGAWTAPVRVHDDTTPTEHGFPTVFPADDGSTELLWLDGRSYASGRKETEVKRRTFNSDGTLSPEVTVDPRACDCCPTAGTVLASGEALVAWRDRIGGEVRDLSTARLTRGAAPVRVHEDGWEFAGCPVNGPALATLGGGAVVSWFTEAGGPRVRVARSADGSTWSGVEDLADGGGVLGRTAALALGDRVLVTWVEKAGESAVLMGRAVSATALGAPVELGDTDGSRGAGFPSLAQIGAEVLIVSAGRGLLVSAPKL